jgi:hypothetical protein
LPIATCQIHRKVQVDEASGLRVCPGEHGGTGRVYEVWDSGMQKLFVQAGLRRATPPAYEPRCGIPASDSEQIRRMQASDAGARIFRIPHHYRVAADHGRKSQDEM